MNLKEYKNKQLGNAQFKKEYEKYDLAFEIGLLIMKTRIRKGLTQEKLAQLINTKQSSIARAENGTSLPSLSFLEKIAIALKTYVKVNFGFLEKDSDIVFIDSASLQNMMHVVISSGYYSPNIKYNLFDQRISSTVNYHKFLVS
ncbi:MAG: helix-turn-helix transcriptional regulator [bacterium]|nr:helix-turn-helix transcriptional regulator [bacterium]